jgi:uncharacterized membrane protein
MKRPSICLAVFPALASGGVSGALLRGAVLGALAYGTYAFTNYAMVEGWTGALVAADVAWGMGLTKAAAAACGLWATRLGS